MVQTELRYYYYIANNNLSILPLIRIFIEIEYGKNIQFRYKENTIEIHYI
jgi:hypothetical protein